MNPPQIAIVGSCVSRDSLEHVTSGPVASPLFYVARQSLISAFAPLREVEVDLEALSSPFQRRMIAGDLCGSAVTALREQAGDVDLLLWDMVDERDGVFATADGGRFTRSPELLASGYPESGAPGVERLDFGSRQQLDEYEQALYRFRGLLDELGLLEKSLFIDAPLAARPWPKAQVDDKAARGVLAQARTLNPVFDQMRIMVREAGMPVLTVPDELCTFNPHHRWGAAPYHYAPPFYDFVRLEIEKRVGAGTQVATDPAWRHHQLVKPIPAEGVFRRTLWVPGASLRLEAKVGGIAEDPLRAAMMLLKLRDGYGVTVEGARPTPHFNGGGHFQYLPLRRDLDILVNWSQLRVVDSVEIHFLESGLSLDRFQCRIG